MSDPHTPTQPALLDDDDRTMLHDRWRQLEERFVDDPADTVRRADALVEEAIDRIRATLDDRRQTLSHRWESVEDATTEQLRAILHHYELLHGQLANAPAPADWHRPDDTGQRPTTHGAPSTRRSGDGDPHNPATADR